MKATLSTLPALCLILLFSSQANADIVAHWTGDNTAIDATGNGHDGTINGAVFGAGQFGQAFVFDGFNDSVIVDANPDLEPTTEISISLWVQAPTENHLRNLIDSTHGVGQAGWAVQLDAADNVRFTYGNGSTFPELATPLGNEDGQFHHVAAIFDGSLLSLYIDGSLSSTLAYSGTALPSGRDIQIGRHLVLNRPFEGSLDDIRIFDNALSSTEVSRLFTGVPEPTALGPLAFLFAFISSKRRRH